MTGIGYDVTEHGVSRAVFDLEQLGVRGKDVRPIARKIRRLFQQSSRRRFERKGPGWPPLADSTREKKQMLGQDPRLMRVTNRLFKSLTATSGPDQYDQADPERLVFGTTVEYARFHQFGTQMMPMRQLQDLTLGERRQVDKLVLDWISRGRR